MRYLVPLLTSLLITSSFLVQAQQSVKIDVAPIAVQDLTGSYSTATSQVLTSPRLTYAISPQLANTIIPGISYDLSFPDNFSTPAGLTFSSDGSRLFVVERESNGEEDFINQYQLTVPFDVTTASFSKQSRIGDIESIPRSITFVNDGTQLILTGSVGIHTFDLQTAFDLTNISLLNTQPAAENFNISGIAYNNTEDRRFLSVRFFGIERIQDDFISVDLPEFGNFFPGDIEFNANGTKVYVSTSQSRIYEYDLDTPFDLSTITFNDWEQVGFNTEAVAFSHNGKKLFAAGLEFGEVISRVYQFEIDQQAFSESSSNNGAVEGEMIVTIAGDTFVNAGGSLTSPEHFTVDNLPSGLIPILSVDEDGLTAILSLSGNAVTHEAANGIDDLKFTFTNAAFTNLEAAEILDANGSASSNHGIDFNDNNNPVFVSESTTTFFENNAGNVLDVNANDGDSGAADENVSYRISGGADELLLSINEDNGLLTFVTPPNFEEPADANADNDYEILVTADDGIGSSGQLIVITVLNVDEDPSFVSIASTSVVENQTGVVLDVDANDGDGGQIDEGIDYTLFGDDEGSFSIDSSSGVLMLMDPLDFENPTDLDRNNNYQLIVTATEGIRFEQQLITITVTNFDEDPLFTSSNTVSFIENTLGTVLDVDANDGDGGSTGEGITYSISGGADQDAFNLDSDIGLLSFNAAPNFELPTDADTDNDYEVQVTANDGVNSSSQIITITVINQDEGPEISDQSFTVNENSVSGTVVGTIEASDVDSESLTFAINSGNLDNAFTITNTGELTVLTTSALDFESRSNYGLTIEVSDGLSASTALVTVNLNNINEAPNIDEQAFDAIENSASGVVVGQLQASDPEGDEITFTLLDGNTQVGFSLDGASGVLEVGNANAINFETNPTFHLTMQVSDGQFSDEAIITINLIDVNEAPLIDDQSFALEENSEVNTIAGVVEAGDPDNDEITFTITSGNTDNAFAIDEATGEVIVANSDAVDFETIPVFVLTIGISDGELSASATLTINLEDVEETEVLGLVNKSDDNITVYPNPAKKKVSISSKLFNQQSDILIRLFDYSGKQIDIRSTRKGDELELFLNDVSPGLYYLFIQIDDKVIPKRLQLTR